MHKLFMAMISYQSQLEAVFSLIINLWLLISYIEIIDLSKIMRIHTHTDAKLIRD